MTVLPNVPPFFAYIGTVGLIFVPILRRLWIVVLRHEYE